MLKMFFLLKRRQGMEPQAFHRYWHEHHGPLFRSSSAARFVMRYEQNHVAPENVAAQGNDFDGVSVMWFRSAEDVDALYADAEYLDIVVPDGEHFLDLTATVRLMTFEESVLIPEPIAGAESR